MGPFRSSTLKINPQNEYKQLVHYSSFHPFQKLNGQPK